MEKKFYLNGKNDSRKAKIRAIKTIKLIQKNNNSILNVNNQDTYSKVENKNENVNNIGQRLLGSLIKNKKKLEDDLQKEKISRELFNLYSECFALQNKDRNNPYFLNLKKGPLDLIYQLYWFIGLTIPINLNQEMRREQNQDLFIIKKDFNLMFFVAPCFFQNIVNNFVFKMKHMDVMFFVVSKFIGIGITTRVFMTKVFSFFLNFVIQFKNISFIFLFDPISYQLELKTMVKYNIISSEEINIHKKFFNKLKFNY